METFWTRGSSQIAVPRGIGSGAFSRTRRRVLPLQSAAADPSSIISGGRRELRLEDAHQPNRRRARAVAAPARTPRRRRDSQSAPGASARNLQAVAAVRPCRRPGVLRTRSRGRSLRHGSEAPPVRPHPAPDWPGTESTLRYRPGQSCRRVFERPAAFTPASSPECAWLRSAKNAKPFIGGVPHERLETESDGIGVRPRAARRPGVAQETLVDVKCLLHTDDYAICVWLRRSGDL